MKVAIIGAGNVGGTLGKGWAKAGHEVVFGVRDASDAKLKVLLATAGDRAKTASVKDAAASADVTALTWIHLAVFQKLGTNFAFRLVKR